MSGEGESGEPAKVRQHLTKAEQDICFPEIWRFKTDTSPWELSRPLIESSLRRFAPNAGLPPLLSRLPSLARCR